MDREPMIERLVPLSELADYDVAEGYPDIRGWPLLDETGREIGTVTDLIVDTTRDEVVSATVELGKRARGRIGSVRVVRVPLAAVSLDETEESIRLTGPLDGLIGPPAGSG